MKRIALCLCLCLCLLPGMRPAAGASGGYADPALNPVTFRKPPQHPPLRLVEDGRIGFVIAGDFAREKNPGCRSWQSVTPAAEALADAFERVFGKRPRIVEDGSPEAGSAPLVIALGETSFSRALGLEPLKMPKEAFLVRSFERGVVIAGRDGLFVPGEYNHMDWWRYRINGTLNGAYDFIERFLGVRYYYPGIGIAAPSRRDLAVQPVHYEDEPYFHNRYNWAWSLEFDHAWPWPGVRKENRFDDAWRLAMSTRFNDVCHTPDPHYLAAAYPDRVKDIFFTDRTGFTYHNPATHIGNLLDVTNPRFADLIVESFRRFYDSDGKWDLPWRQNGRGWYPPNSEYALFGQADTYVLDLNNERTRHLFPPSRPANVVSDLYMNFYVQVARGMQKHLPGKRLGVLAYHNYTLPPIVCTDIPDNLDVQVCEGRIVMARADASRKQWKELFQGWCDVLGGRKVTAWTYGAQNNLFTQAIQGRYLQDYVRLLKPYLSRKGFFIDAGGLKWHFYYSYYLCYRVLWNPEFDIRAALDEHWTLLYGPAAGRHLKRFYDLLVDRWENVYIAELNRRGIREDNATPARLYAAYNLPVVDELEGLLGKALAATAPGSLERLRVEYFAAPWKQEFASARAYCTQVTPVYKVRRLGSRDAVVVDGVLDEGIWSQAPSMALKDAKGSGLPVVTDPQAKMVWDPQGLYIGFKCGGVPQCNRGDIWFGSDSIEVFLSPGTEKAVYYQFAMNPTNDFHDAYKVEKPMEAALDSKWEAAGLKRAARAEADGWSAEIFIPFGALHRRGAPRVYSTWFANFINNKLDGKRNVAEYSSFAMTMGNNHNHSLWGKIKFMGKGD